MIRTLPRAAGIAMLSGVIAAGHLGKVSPAITALQDELQLSLVAAGFLLSLMQGAGMLLGLLMGFYCDRLGARNSIVLGQALLTAASLAGATAHNAETLLALRAVESLGLLMVTLPTPGLLRRVVPEDRLSFSMGLWGCYVALGTAAAFLGGPLAIEWFGWRLWWTLPALGSALMILGVLRWVPADPARPERSGDGLRQTLRQLLQGRDAWLVGIGFALYAGQWLAVIGFLPTIFAGMGAGPVLIGVLCASAALANIVGSLSAAVLLHRGVGVSLLLRVGYLGMTVMSVIAFSSWSSGLPVMQFVALLMFSALGGLIPGSLFLLAVKAAPTPQRIASTVGRVQQLTSMGMFSLPPLLAKMTAFAGGWQWTWVFSGVASVVAVLVLALREGE
ncbi:MFS transporter [Pseudomonas sp. Marseille-P9899]|uniref:MFS transporter n=1 Tax=Pseudomonas sp. Marseille-P9899 TaxID=2730401 RepID=UPI00158ACC52|nr:MFS transporter [Pseudomonas sp. Marseille-P9899]